MAVATILYLILLTIIGLLVGTVGTIVGAGGGFLLAPVLVLLYPKDSPELLTSISLAVVLINAISGSIAYAKLKRIDFKAGLQFSMAAMPGAAIGAALTRLIPRSTFDLILGTFLALAGAALFFKDPAARQAKVQNGDTEGVIIDVNGAEYRYRYNLRRGIYISMGVGFISSLLGLGGGIMHVPAMIFLLNFPVAVATATSQFILGIMAFVGTAVHTSSGALVDAGPRIFAIALGVIVGAQIGARLSQRIGGRAVVRTLAVALVCVGARVVWGAF